MAPTGTLEQAQTIETVPARQDEPSRSTVSGGLLLGLGAAAFAVWFAWRVTHLVWHPIGLVFLLTEVAGAVGAVAVGLGLYHATEPRTVYGTEPRDSHWFAHATADIVGRTRAADLHRQVRTAVRAAPRWRPRNTADATIAAILFDGPRRLLMIVTVSVGLLLGVTPFGRPPSWAASALVVGFAAVSAAHVALGRGRLRFGDRLRWSYGAIGEVVSRSDVIGHAPRRWVGAMGSVVGLSIAIALRGMSDRWTHGLPPMSDDDRVVAMLVAVSLLLGALFTIRTTPRPQQTDPFALSRRLEETTARQSTLAAAVCVGMIGLIAGVLPTDAAAHGRTPVDPMPAVQLLQEPSRG